jgi:hypothetical protein
VADAEPVGAADERRAQEARLGDRAIENALGRVAGDAEPEGPKARTLAVEEGGGPEALLEAP